MVDESKRTIPACVDLRGAVGNVFAAAHDLALHGGNGFTKEVFQLLADRPDSYEGITGEMDPRATKALDLVVELYNLAETPSEPKEERSGLLQEQRDRIDKLVADLDRVHGALELSEKEVGCLREGLLEKSRERNALEERCSEFSADHERLHDCQRDRFEQIERCLSGFSGPDGRFNNLEDRIEKLEEKAQPQGDEHILSDSKPCGGTVDIRVVDDPNLTHERLRNYGYPVESHIVASWSHGRLLDTEDFLDGLDKNRVPGEVFHYSHTGEDAWRWKRRCGPWPVEPVWLKPKSNDHDPDLYTRLHRAGFRTAQYFIASWGTNKIMEAGAWLDGHFAMSSVPWPDPPDWVKAIPRG